MTVHRNQSRCVLRSAVGVVIALLVHSSAFAQRDVPQATVLENAPIFIYPDSTRQPLRVAAPNTRLDVLGAEGAWLNVRFQDPVFGPRIGYIEAKFVRRETPENLRPIDLSVPRPGTANAGAPQSSPVDGPQQPGFIPQGPRTPLARQGLWVNVGLGYGTIGCFSDCLTRLGGGSGNFSIGTTSPSGRWYYGVGTTGFYRSTLGLASVTAGTLDMRARFYPSRYQGFYVTFGGGLADARFQSVFGDDDWAFGVGTMGGVGWDLRVGRNVSLTPYYHGVFMFNNVGNLNFDQIGLGVTVH